MEDRSPPALLVSILYLQFSILAVAPAERFHPEPGQIRSELPKIDCEIPKILSEIGERHLHVVRAIGPHHTKSAWSDPATILVN